MGQKVHPVGFRIAYNLDWQSKWFISDKRDYARNVVEDFQIRKYIGNYYKHAFIARINIEKRDRGNSVIINIVAEKPGYLIGKGGEEIDTLIKNLEFQTGKKIAINITEIQNPDCDALIVSQRIAFQLEKRMFFRKAMNDAAATSLEAGALGIKIQLCGRVGGSEMSRTEKLRHGNIPLNTLRANIGFGLAEATTKYGKIGIKVWIHTGFTTKREFQNKIRETETIKEGV